MNIKGLDSELMVTKIHIEKDRHLRITTEVENHTASKNTYLGIFQKIVSGFIIFFERLLHNAYEEKDLRTFQLFLWRCTKSFSFKKHRDVDVFKTFSNNSLFLFRYGYIFTAGKNEKSRNILIGLQE